jgi:glycosyltransferase involved in cell wall biosynthesis
VRRAAARVRPALVHANTTRASIGAVAARHLGGPPAVAHIRDWVPEGRASAATLRFVAGGAAVTLANSRFTADQIRPGLGHVRVIHNPVDLERLDPARHDAAAARAALGVGEHDELLAVVAQLTPWKGQRDAVEALRRVREQRPRARLLLAGSAKFASGATRFDNATYAAELEREVAATDGAALLLGEREDVPTILAATDVLLVPSWREAFGRIAAEAMAMGVPVVATAVGGPAEIVRDGVDGRVLEPRDPRGWAAAIVALLADKPARAAMGAAARERALREFAPALHAERIRDAYAYALG